MTQSPYNPAEDARLQSLEDNDTTENATVVTNTAGIASINKLNGTKTAHLVWDFAVDGGAVSAISMLDSDGVVFSLPNNSYITKSYYEVITTFTSPTSDIASVSLGHADDAAGIFAAETITNATAWDALSPNFPLACIQTGVISTTTVKTTAARPILFTIAVEAITAGKMHLFLEYVTTE